MQEERRSWGVRNTHALLTVEKRILGLLFLGGRRVLLRLLLIELCERGQQRLALLLLGHRVRRDASTEHKRGDGRSRDVAGSKCGDGRRDRSATDVVHSGGLGRS